MADHANADLVGIRNWSGRTALVVRKLDPAWLSRDLYGLELRTIFPDLARLSCRLGWQLFTITWIPGWSEPVPFQDDHPWYCVYWLRRLGTLVFLLPTEEMGCSSLSNACPLNADPRDIPPGHAFGVCVTELAAEQFAHKWDRLLAARASASEKSPWLCAALALECLAEHTLVYLRKCRAEPALYVGAVHPKLEWPGMLAPLEESCRACGLAFVEESKHGERFMCAGATNRDPNPSYVAQPIIVPMRAPVTPMTESAQANAPGDTADRASCSQKTKGLLRKLRRRLGYRLGREPVWRDKLGPIEGAFAAYVVGYANTYWTYWPVGEVPLAWAPRSKHWDNQVDIQLIAEPTYYAIWAASLTALGWCVGAGSLSPLPGEKEWLDASDPRPYPPAPHDDRMPWKRRDELSILLSASMHGSSCSGPVAQRYRLVGNRLDWVVATRDLRWAWPLLWRSTYPYARRRRRAPRNLQAYLSKCDPSDACFVVDNSVLRSLLAPERMLLLQQSISRPAGIRRILAGDAIAITVGGLVFVRDSMVREFERALGAAALAAGAGIRWLDLPDADELLRPPPVDTRIGV